MSKSVPLGLRFRRKTVRQSASLDHCIFQGRSYASKHCKSSCKQSCNDRERLWARTTNSRMFTDIWQCRVQHSKVSAPRSTCNMSTNFDGNHVTQHKPMHHFTGDEDCIYSNQTGMSVINCSNMCLAILNVNTSFHLNVSLWMYLCSTLDLNVLFLCVVICIVLVAYMWNHKMTLYELHLTNKDHHFICSWFTLTFPRPQYAISESKNRTEKILKEWGHYF